MKRVTGVVVGAAAAVALVAGCGGSRPSPPSASPSASPSAAATPATAAATSALAARYLTIANVGNRRLEVDFDRLQGPDAGNLAAAEADLRDAAATEHEFDSRLAAIAFPPAMEAVARTLFVVNESRAGLTAMASTSTSLRHLRDCQEQLSAANVPVEQAVTSLRSLLGLPPPSTS
jgi:hypothetical protein